MRGIKRIDEVKTNKIIIDGGGLSASNNYNGLLYTSRVPVGGKSSVCLICMKYRIIILIIIIKRLGEILLSYIAHMHTPLPLCGYGPGL